jgi:hypothetical protein
VVPQGRNAIKPARFRALLVQRRAPVAVLLPCFFNDAANAPHLETTKGDTGMTTGIKSSGRFYKVNLGGFSNTNTYIRILNDEQAAAVEKRFDGLDDLANGGHLGWTRDKAASHQAINFEDIDMFLPFHC